MTSKMFPNGIPPMVVRAAEPEVPEPVVFEPTAFEPTPAPRSHVEAARADGIQECLHILSGSLMDASFEVPHMGASGVRRSLDVHTIEALMLLVGRRTKVPYDGSTKR